MLNYDDRLVFHLSALERFKKKEAGLYKKYRREEKPIRKKKLFAEYNMLKNDYLKKLRSAFDFFVNSNNDLSVESFVKFFNFASDFRLDGRRQFYITLDFVKLLNERKISKSFVELYNNKINKCNGNLKALIDEYVDNLSISGRLDEDTIDALNNLKKAREENFRILEKEERFVHILKRDIGNLSQHTLNKVIDSIVDMATDYRMDNDYSEVDFSKINPQKIYELKNYINNKFVVPTIKSDGASEFVKGRAQLGNSIVDQNKKHHYKGLLNVLKILNYNPKYDKKVVLDKAFENPDVEYVLTY